MLRVPGAAGPADTDHPPSRTITKPPLLAITRAVEESTLAAPGDPPFVVVALFQHRPYFVRSAEIYARLAGIARTTVVGFAGGPPLSLPDGVTHVALACDEPLAREWSVTVLGPRSGATVVAQDLERVDGSARSLERGRTFSARWSFRRAAAAAELRRLRTGLGARLPVDDELDRALDEDRPDTDADRRHDAAVAVVVERLAAQQRRADQARNELGEAVPGAERDPQSGLPTRAFLDRWTAGSASGTLPVGLALFRVHELALVRRRHGPAAEREVCESIGRVLRRHTVDADRVVRVGREEFLLVLPSRGTEQLARWTERARAEIGALSGGHPFVPTPASAVITRTRRRPLPLGPLWAALDRAVEAGAPVTVLGD